MAERSLEMLYGITGILKAGATYVPIDLSYSQEEKKYIIDECGAKTILIYGADAKKAIEELKCEDKAEVIDLADNEFFTGMSENLERINRPEDLAYVLYTSETTGKTNGVMIENRSVVRLVKNSDYVVLNENSIILQTSSMSFDAFTFEIWGALLNGGKLILPRGGIIKSSIELKQSIQANHVNVMWLPSTTFNQLLLCDNGLFDGLNYLIISGEKASEKHVRKYQEKNSKTKLINAYIYTENTTFTTTYEIPKDFEDISMGKPINNTKVYIVKDGALCGIGMLGELCIGGLGVSRGYLNNPELTQKKFINNSYGEGKLYCTGDLARWLPDGNLEYLGKVEQVKIKDFRIELGKIESIIRKNENIADVVVITKKDEIGKEAIYAYIVSDENLNLGTLREELRKELPEYMLPSYMMQINEIPVARNGKLDKSALPQIEENTINNYIAPRNIKEKALCDVYESILGVHVGITSNFFELGGDSIKAIRLVSKIRENGFNITIKEIMKYDTVELLATRINEVEENKKYEQEEVIGKIIMTPIQRAFFEWKLYEPWHFNQAVILKSNTELKEEYVKKALEALAIHHDVLRMVYKEELSILSVKESNLYEMYVYDHRKTKKDLKIEIEEINSKIQSEMNLENGPILKAVLHKTSSGDHLLLTVHHLAVDGVSWRILVEDFETTYRQAEKGQKIILPKKTASFKEWSEALNEYSDSKLISDQEQYWKDVSREISEYTIPETSDVKEVHIGSAIIEFDEETTYKLLHDVGKAYGTEINDLLLTALGMAIKESVGLEKIGISLEGHGREEIHRKIETYRTVGWFTSVYPIIIDAQGEIEQQIIHNKEMLRRIPNHGIGYGVLTYGQNRKLKNLTPNIGFNYLGELDNEIKERGMFCTSEYSTGECVAKRNSMTNTITFLGSIIEGKLKFQVNYISEKHTDENIKTLCNCYNEALKRIVNYCMEQDEKIITASDVGVLDIKDLDFKKAIANLGICINGIETTYSLTPMQEGMLYHKILNEESTEYVLQNVINVNGRVDDETILKSLGLLSYKYAILRTAFLYKECTVFKQIVFKERQIEINIEDLSKLEKSEQNYILERIKDNDLKRGFRLDRDSLLRVTIVKLEKDECKMIWSSHHIIMDGWCLSLLFSDFINYYQVLSEGADYEIVKNKVSEEKNKILPYGDYIKYLEKQDKKEGLEYFRELLSGYDTPAEIVPLQKTEDQEIAVETLEKVFENDLCEQLRKISAENNITVNTIFEAAWGIVLQRYNVTEDAVFGKVVSGRNAGLLGIERAVGLFINTIPVRVDCNEYKKKIGLLKELQEQAFESGRYDFCPLSEVQQESTLKDKLIKTLFVYENFYVDKRVKDGIPGLDISVESDRDETNYPISIRIFGTEYITVRIQYQSRMYSREEIEKLLERYKLAVRELIQDIQKPIGEIDLTTQEEKNLILYRFNDTDTEYLKNKTVAELFEEQVKKTPDNIAVVFEGEEITYRDLNNKANQLAFKLRNLGVGVDDYVPIMAERSIEMVCGILGIIKAGGAYVPIDSAYPQERISYILGDCAPQAILLYGDMVKKTFEKLKLKEEIQVIELSECKFYEGVSENLEIINSTENLAYVIYTSGTTGKPKGSMIENQSIVRLVKNPNYVKLDESSIILQTGSISFDASTFEIWGALLNGGKLVLPGEGVITSSVDLRERIISNKVNTMWITSTLFNQLLLLDNSLFYTLNYLLIGGEKLSENHVRIFKETNTATKLINGYGPTENTTFTTTYEIPDKFESIPIGKPINDTKVYIIKSGNLCGIGMPGELCTSGRGVSRGYLNMPQLTNEKFITNPYGDGKLYRTGDLAKWLPDGNIEYLGRIDEQVKIRGFRIELEEIESIIRKNEYIKDVAVLARIDANADKAIYAYIVSDIIVDIAELREQLRKELPDYMLPSYMMQIVKIPITPNGKLDKKELPDIEIRMTNDYIAPRDKIEEIICNIYAETLGIEKVSITESFFEIGGHSLRAVKVINRLEELTGLRLSIKDLFDSPTAESLAKIISNARHEVYEEIPKAEEKEFYPVSSAQKRLYLINEIDEQGTTYNIPSAVILSGDADINKINRVFKELIKRHEILRTCIVMKNGEPVQKIMNAEDIHANVDLIDLKEADENSKKDIFARFVRPFDLSQAPLVRSAVVELDEKNSLLLFDMHHIISDGATMANMISEFNAMYKGEELEPLKLQYKDYSEWMRTRDLSSQKEYWLNEFSKEIPILDLPYDYARGQIQRFEGSTINGVIGKEIKEKIKKLSKKTGATEYMILLSGLMALLAKYSRQDDILIGSPIAGRVHKNTEKMLGMFINTLVMRGYPEKNKKFEDFLYEIKEMALNAYDNQEYPFEELVENVQFKRDISRNPLFDIMFVLQNNETKELDIEDKSEYSVVNGDTRINLGYSTAKFDLKLNIIALNNEYKVVLEYRTDLFKDESIRNMLKHYIKVIDEVVSNPEKKIQEIEVITEDEIQEILYRFNDTDAEYPKNKTVGELFEEQVERIPDKTAVVFEGKEVTYRELNTKANQIAYKLRELEVGSDDFIVIMAERSLEMIYAIYGIIKAGGAYIPIDPASPHERISYMLGDCAPKAALIYGDKAQKTANELHMKDEIEVFDLSNKEIYTGMSKNPENVNKPEDLIYVIYTSGTSGAPKGVMVENRNVTNFCSYLDTILYKDDNDVSLLIASYVFDASIKMLFTTLLNGHVLHIVPDEIKNDKNKMCKYINDNKINVMDGTPSYYKEIFLSQKNSFNLKKCILGGEELTVSICDKLKEIDDIEIINSYGPTEATVDATCYVVGHFELKNIRVPIGKPINNVKVYIMSDNMLCGIGIPGELCIAGTGVSRGYLNRRELTDEKFIDNLYGKGKMYKTGDLARWMPDGNIEYLGRMDEQVKIRGFRIELGEIESVLQKKEYITAAAVVVKVDDSGDKAINAYIVSDERVEIKKLRDDLRKQLPEYMIPSYIMQLEKIPVTVNGKLDKMALPEIEKTTVNEYIEPRDKAEEIICRIYEEVLGIEKVSIKDSFLEIGGHSLSAIKVINRIEEETGIRLAVKDLFTSPSAENMAEIIKSIESKVYEEIPKVEEKEYYPVSSTQKRQYMINEINDVGIAYNMPAAVKLNGVADVERISKVVNELIKRHEILRTCIVMKDGELVQKIISAEDINTVVKYINLKNMDEKSKKEKIAGFVRPFNLGHAPLIRVVVADIDEKNSLLLVDMHHIISDAVARANLIREFNALYKGEELETLRVQYKDYSEWMRKRDLSSQKEYWNNEFSGDIPVLDLPYDHVRGQVQKFEGNTVKGVIGYEIKGKIDKLCKKTGTTAYMVLLSGLMVLLAKYSRQEDIIIGSPVAGRTHKDTEKMLGMFINTLAMRGYPKEHKKFEEFLYEIKEANLKAYDNQEYPFEELVEQIQINRDMSRNPLFDVMFVLQNSESEEVGLAEKSGKAEINLGYKIAKFDITVYVNIINDEYDVAFEYRTDLFEEESIRNILKHYINIVEDAVNYPEKEIKDIEVLKEDEKEKILYRFNDTYSEYKKDKTVIELFEEQVEKTPDNIGVVFKENEVTYRELNRKANQVAYKLRKLGVGRDDFIVILAERSLEMIYGIYGILKAGGAYVPVEPSLPKERISYMINDCEPKAVLIYGKEAQKVVEGWSIKTEIEIIDLADSKVYKGVSKNPVKINKAEDVAYVIYTSGTTGKPKGVMVEHCNVGHYITNHERNIYGGTIKGNIKKILGVTNMSFDIFVTEIILSLVHGMELYLTGNNEYNNPQRIAEIVDRYDVEIIQTTPSKMKMYLEGESYKKYLSKFKTILLGGESVPLSLCNELRKYTKAKIVNVYGPSEATVWATMGEIKPGIHRNIIGTPMSNVQIYIMNNKHVCGIGMPGELCIAGDGVARGYLNRLELTKEKFIDNPYGEGRMYLTGDLARWLPYGNIEYLGRKDEQVKIRGYRIELGEIESVIRTSGYVTDVAVIARTDTNGDNAIYAYIVSDESVDIGKLREELRKEIPEYMIPSYMVQIEKIPINKNGKLDKKALPEIEILTLNKYIAPKNKTEEIICNIYAEILGMEKVSITDSFFEIGGHSLRAVKVINRIEKEIGVRLPVKELFTSPTAEGMAKIIRNIEKEDYKEIPKAEVREYYSASSAQKRQYMINEIDDTGTAYNMPVVVRLNGNADLEKIKKVFVKLIRRHEILRTCFIIVDGEIVQKIISAEDINPDISYMNLKNADEFSKKEKLAGFVHPFDLSQAPLVRLALAEIGENENFLLFDVHHIISDGVTMANMISEFNALYNGEELEPLKLQYKDYSEWMKTRDINSQKEYWLNEFSGEISVLSLPYDHARGKTQKFEGNIVKTKIGKELKEKIEELSKKTGATEYMILLSGLMVLLEKYSRQEDIIIGSPVAGRVHKDTEKMFGMFINTLPLRGYPQKNKKYEDFLYEIKETALRAYDNQEYPFEELVEHVKVNREMSRNPMFDIMFVLQNNESEELEFVDKSGYEIKIGDSDINLGYRAAKFDITVNLKAVNEGYVLEFIYRTDLFEDESMRNMLKQFLKVVDDAVSNPEKEIKDIEAITEEEKEKILYRFNDTVKDYPRDKVVSELFEEQVDNTPNNVALVFQKKEITYSELNRRANQVAHKLRKLGIGADVLVPIMAEKSLEMIYGILGIIKAGGAYVPIDPTYPMERISYMIDDCAPQAMLIFGDVANEMLEKLNIKDEIDVIDLSDSKIYEGMSENPANFNQPEDLVYVIYTSGTTGKPKGSMIEHKSVNRLVKNTNYVELDQNTVILQTGAISFDASTFEIWGSLLNGGKLYLVSNDILLNPNMFKRTISECKINTIFLTTALFNQMINTDVKIFDDLKYLITGGEIISEKHARILRESNQTLNLLNAYGPTENTTFTTTCEIPCEFESIPIGKPIANTQIYILSEKNLCGIGMPGELCTAGSGVSRGYLNLPKLTDEKFVDNPYGEGMMYHTGDLARWLPDGDIEYLGRMDEQIKIRGFRIELGEIESAIMRKGYVADTAVIAENDANGDMSIYAYIVSGERVDIGKLREELRRDLPEYMIPPYMMQIEKIPVTKNGKIDKKALPEINVLDYIEYELPRNEVERSICNIFKKILGIDKVGINEKFFEIGGNSINAMGCVVEAKKMGYDISIKDIFYYQNVKEISENIKEKENEIVKQSVESNEQLFDSITKVKNYLLVENNSLNNIILSRDIEKSYNMTSMQNLFLKKNILLSGMIIDLKEELDIERMKRSIKTLINSQTVLRSTLAKENEKIVIKQYKNIAETEEISIPIIDLSKESEEKASEIIEYITKEIFTKWINDKESMYNRLLFQIVCVKFAPNSWKVYIPVNHLIFDGMSIEILKSNLLKIYKNNINFIKEESYYEYVYDIQKGNESIEKNDKLINSFNLNKFKDRLDKLDSSLEKGLKNTSLRIKMLKRADQMDKKQLWEISYKTFKKLVGYTFEQDEIPFLLLAISRQYNGNNYYNTIGEMLDILPLSDFVSKDEIDYGYTSNFIKRKEVANINFAEVLFGDKETRCNQLENIRKEIKEKLKALPVYNYLGLYEIDVKEKIKPKEEKLNKELTMMVNISFDQNEILVYGFCKENEEKELHKLLEQYVKEIT